MDHWQAAYLFYYWDPRLVTFPYDPDPCSTCLIPYLLQNRFPFRSSWILIFRTLMIYRFQIGLIHRLLLLVMDPHPIIQCLIYSFCLSVGL